MGKYLGLRPGATLKGVSPEIVDIVQNAIAAIPYDAKIISGERPKGLGNHNHGYAIDVQLYQDGKPLPNKGTAAYAAYEQYAQAARVYQQQKYPALPLRTGLGFATVRGGKTLDPMHLDITPHRSMPLYNWDTGGIGAYAKFSNGGLGGGEGARRVSQLQQQLAGGPIPPLGILGIPTPRSRPAALSVPSLPNASGPPDMRSLFGSTGQVMPAPSPAFRNVVPPPNLPLNPPMPARPQVDGTRAYAPVLGNDGTLDLRGDRVGLPDYGPGVTNAHLPAYGMNSGLGSLNDPRIAALQGTTFNGNAMLGAGRPGVVAPNTAPPRVPPPSTWGSMAAAGPFQSPAVPNMPRPPLPQPRNASIGMVAPGNLDLNNRPAFFFNDGNYGTEYSISVGTDQGEVLIPTIVNGKKVSNDEAIKHYQQTGENLGTFSSPEAADRYAVQLHQRDQGLANMPVPIPGRPAALMATPSLPAAPAAAPVAAQPPPVSAPPVQLRLPSGKTIAPGIYNQGDHSVSVTDAGDGTAKVTKITSPGSIPGILDPLREVGNKTVAGGVIRSMIPKGIDSAVSNLTEAAPQAINNVKDTALSAAANLGNQIGNVFTGMFGGNSSPAPASVPRNLPTPNQLAAINDVTNAVQPVTSYQVKQVQTVNPAYTAWAGRSAGSDVKDTHAKVNVQVPPPPQYITSSVKVPVTTSRAPAPAYRAPAPALPPLPTLGNGLLSLLAGQINKQSAAKGLLGLIPGANAIPPRPAFISSNAPPGSPIAQATTNSGLQNGGVFGAGMALPPSMNNSRWLTGY